MTIKKFTDEELIELHKKGLSDNKIGIRLGVTRGNIGKRRWKLGLYPNRKATHGNGKNTKEDMKKARREYMRKKQEIVARKRKEGKLPIIYKKEYRYKTDKRCEDCGKKILDQSKLCKSCSIKRSWRNRK